MNKSSPNFFAKRSLSPQELEKIQMKKVNNYDFDKMLEEFKFHDSLTKLKKNRLHKVRTANLAYRKNIDQMRTKVQTAEKQRIKDIKKVLQEKERIVEANKYFKSRERREHMVKTLNDRVKLKQTAKENVELHLAGLEEKRLEQEHRTLERLRIYNEKYNEMNSLKKITFSKKLQDNYDKYEHHNQIFLNNETTVKQTKEEERLKRYTDIFWRKRERARALKNKKKKNENKLEKVKEMKDEKEKELSQKNAKIIKKYEDMNYKKQLLEEEKGRRIQQTIQEEQTKKAHIHNNIEKLKREEVNFREGILLYQREMIGRSLTIDRASALKKYSAQESTVFSQIGIEKSVPGFTIEMNHLKNESISKKNFNQRKKIYKNILRLEEERMKREAEDKLLKQ